MSTFFIVLARDKKYVMEKIAELDRLCVRYLIICGERLDHPRITYRSPRGKYDAINFAATLIPKDVDTVIFNDVDTKIHNLHIAIHLFKNQRVDLLFATELINSGPQRLFFRLFNPIRRIIPLAASGELMLIRREVLDKILPVKCCKAEDTYILFKILELGYTAVFCEDCYAETERTQSLEKEEKYKRRTVAGIYQALSYSNPPLMIKIFYRLLPFLSPILLIIGKKGYFWMKGILFGFLDYLRGDRSGLWEPT